MHSKLHKHILYETQRLLKRGLAGYRITIPNKALSRVRATGSCDVPAKQWIRIHKQIHWIKKELGKSAITGKPINLQYTGIIDIAILLETDGFQIWWLNYPPDKSTIPDAFTIPLDLPDTFTRIINHVKSYNPNNNSTRNRI